MIRNLPAHVLGFSLLARGILSVIAAQERPNVVFFLVDDLGYMDISAYNPDSFYETPNCNRIASSGCRFTNGYAANPVCSPTRYSIMTGRHPSRPDATNFFSGRRGGRFQPAPLHDRMQISFEKIDSDALHLRIATEIVGPVARRSAHVDIARKRLLCDQRSHAAGRPEKTEFRHTG